MGKQFNQKRNIRVKSELTFKNRSDTKGPDKFPDDRRKFPQSTFKAKFKSSPLRPDESRSTEGGTGDFFIKTETAKPSTSSEDNTLTEPPRRAFNTFKENPCKDEPRGKPFGKQKKRGVVPLPDDAQKKVFDKKLWRLHKYSHKYKLEQWEGKRKRTMLNEYYKQIKDDGPSFDVQKIYEEECNEEENDNENNLNTNIKRPDSMSPATQTHGSELKKKKAFMKAHMQFDRVKSEKQVKKEEYEKKRAEREEALKEYKKKKAEKYKKLSKRTKKGQPIMKDRMEMLLEQIQNSINHS